MNHEKAFGLVGQANPLPSDSTGPDGFLSMTALLDRIDERSTDMQTRERPLVTNQEPPGRTRPRWLIPALAGAVAVIVAIGIGALLSGGDDEPEVINPGPSSTPLEIGRALHAAALAGNWEAIVQLHSADATTTFAENLGGLTFPMSDVTSGNPAFPGEATYFTLFDWDNDGVTTGFDFLASDIMAEYAMGSNRYSTCVQSDPTTLVCVPDHQAIAFSFEDGTGISSQQSLTIEAGRIIDTFYEDTGSNAPFPFNLDLSRDYERWIRDSRAELYGETLFRIIPSEGNAVVGFLIMTSETVEAHRELIAEWQVQR